MLMFFVRLTGVYIFCGTCEGAVVHPLKVYNSVISSLLGLLYANPSFCNLRKFLQAKLVTFERRVFRIIDDKNVPNVIETGEKMCLGLFKNVSCMPYHPLRQCFSHRSTVSRASIQLPPPRGQNEEAVTIFYSLAR